MQLHGLDCGWTHGFYLVTELELDTSGSRAAFLLRELQGTNKESVNYVIIACSFSHSCELNSFVDVSYLSPSGMFKIKTENQFIKLGLLFLGW